MRLASVAVSVTACLLLAAGCNKKDEANPGKEPGGENKPADPGAKPTPQTLAQAIAGAAKPGLFGPFAKASFGMTQDELRTASPAYAAAGDYLAAQEYGISYFVGFDGEPKRFSQLRVTVPAADVAGLEQSWGPATAIDYRRKPAKVWLDPAAKVRVIATDASDAGEQTLIISPYLPVSEILGEPGKPLGIETAKPFLGATAAELEAAYPDHFDRNLETLAFMEWPADDYGDSFKLELGQDQGKVVSLQFWIHHGDEAAVKQAMLAVLEAKYGKAVESKSALGRKQLQLSADPKVTVAETTGAWVIEIGAK